MAERIRSELFDPSRHDPAGFCCGEESLETWLMTRAASAAQRGAARIWVWTDEEGRIVGYYALAAHKIVRQDVPSRIGRGQSEIPAVLLAKLALDESVQRRGLGAELLDDALERIVEATRTVARRVVVVDALTESAARFSEHLGFRRIPGSLRLVQKLSDITAALEPGSDE